jgi:hypothetical protein
MEGTGDFTPDLGATKTPRLSDVATPSHTIESKLLGDGLATLWEARRAVALALGKTAIEHQ